MNISLLLRESICKIHFFTDIFIFMVYIKCISWLPLDKRIIKLFWLDFIMGNGFWDSFNTRNGTFLC